MAMMTSTTRTTPNKSGWCAAESESAGYFSFPALYRAYRYCRRGKRNTRTAQRYEARLLDNLVETVQALESGVWRPSRSFCFVSDNAKPREIHAAAFGDRVVHHLLVPALEALYEPCFIHDSYASRQGKGSHAAVDRLQAFMRRVSGNDQRAAWYLQLDIRNFFNRIDRRILYHVLQQRLSKAVRHQQLPRAQALQLRDLCRVLLSSEPSRDALLQGDPERFQRLPAHKRLANAAPGKGLPIGNLSSQFFANVYLNELDQFVKHQLGGRYYLRYVDDVVLLHEDPAQLRHWREQIEAFLATALELELRDTGKLARLSDGVDFLGYIVRPNYRLVRRRVVGNCRARLQAAARRLLWRSGQGHLLLLRQPERDALRASLASYLGHLRHANSARLRAALWQHYPWLGKLFELAPDGRLQVLWEPRQVSSLRSQWRYFRRQYPDSLLLVQTGRTVEAYDQQAIELAQRLNLPLSSRRPGFSHTLSLPLGRLCGLRMSLRRRAVAHGFIAEEGYLKRGLKRRVLRLLWRPLPFEYPTTLAEKVSS